MGRIVNIGHTLVDFAEAFAMHAKTMDSVCTSINWARRYDEIAVAVIKDRAEALKRSMENASDQCTELKTLYDQHEATLPTEGKLFTNMQGFAGRLLEFGKTIPAPAGKVIEDIEPYRPILEGVPLDNHSIFNAMAGTPESVKALLVPYRAVLEPKVHVMGEFVALKRMMVGTAQLRMTDYHAAETFEALVGKVAKTQTHCNALYSSFARVGRYLFPLSEIRSTDDTPPRP